jgi:hypothetical protein
MGIMFGTYDTIAVAGPIMVWWERRIAASDKTEAASQRGTGVPAKGNPARVDRGRNSVNKPSRVA